MLIFAGIFLRSHDKAIFRIRTFYAIQFVHKSDSIFKRGSNQNIREVATDHVAFLATGETKLQS